MTTYTIWHDQGINDFIEVVTSTGLVNSYVVVTGITVDTVYKFKVQASNVLGRSDFSPESVGIRAASVPDAPSQPVKVDATTSMIHISWAAPDYDGGNALSNYKVYISISNNFEYFELGFTNDPLVTEMVAEPLQRGELYYFKVTAWNIIGESAPSVETAILAATVPLQPA